MTNKQIEQAREYAEALLNRAELCEHGSAAELRHVLAAIVELQALRAIPQALPDAKRAA